MLLEQLANDGTDRLLAPYGVGKVIRDPFYAPDVEQGGLPRQRTRRSRAHSRARGRRGRRASIRADPRFAAAASACLFARARARPRAHAHADPPSDAVFVTL